MWIGLARSNDTAAQYRSETDLHALGFRKRSDVAEALLFVSGLGGHRAAVNGRPLDPTAVRGSVTEWSNRTFYFGEDVTADLQDAADGPGGKVVVAVELYKHWYGLSNRFYPVAYGPRSLKAVLVLTHTNGTSAFLSPTCSATSSGSNASCGWRHGSGSTLYEDLHTGQIADGRLASPGWEAAGFVAGPAWRTPAAVVGPPGELRPHPMQRSRVRPLPTSTSFDHFAVRLDAPFVMCPT